MNTQAIVYVSLFLGTLLVNMSILIWTWRQRHVPGALAFAVLMVVAGWWVAARLLIRVGPVSLAPQFDKLSFIIEPFLGSRVSGLLSSNIQGDMNRQGKREFSFCLLCRF